MWKIPDNLKAELEQHGYRFDFFEVTRRVNQLMAVARRANHSASASRGSVVPEIESQAESDGASAPSEPMHEASTAGGERSDQPNRLNFLSSTSKKFPNRQVADLVFAGTTCFVTTSALGSFGHTGSLPRHDWDLLASRRSEAFGRAFLNIFNHRQIENFYRAWEKHRIDIGRETAKFEQPGRRAPQPDTAGDRVGRLWLALTGFRLPSMRQRHEFSDVVFAGLASYFARPVRTPEALARSLQAQFGVHVEIRQFVENRLTLPARSRTRLGVELDSRSSAAGTFNRLGGNAILGRIVPNHHSRFEVILGPLDKYQLQRLSPFVEGNSFVRLRQFLQAYCGPSLDFDIRYRVQKEAVTRTCLGETRLGFNSWVLHSASAEDRQDPVVRFTWGNSNSSAQAPD